MIKAKPFIYLTLITIALWLLILFPILAEITINKPLYVLKDINGNVVATNSISIEKAMEKASALPKGDYSVSMKDATITKLTDTCPSPTIITISWTAPTENTDNSPLTDLANYKIYYGLTTTSMTEAIVDTGTSKKITGLAPNIYYFAVSAINSLGVESELSNVVSKVVM